MRTQEVIIGNPKRDVVDRAILCTISAGSAVGFLECRVQSLDELLERAGFFRYFIVICKTNDLGDEDFAIFFNLKLLGITISDEFQGFDRKFLKRIKCYPHGKNTGTNIAECKDLISKNRLGYLVHDEPDIRLNAFDFCVDFSDSQFIGRFVVVGIHERPYDNSSGFGIVLLIVERGCPFGKLIEIHVEQVHRELAVEIAQLIFPVF